MSDTLSLLSIATRAPPPDARSNPLDFWACVEVLEDNDWFQNSNKTRSVPIVELGPSPRQKPEQTLTPLVTGKRLRRHKWTETQIPK